MIPQERIEGLVRRIYPRRGWRGVAEEAPFLKRATIIGTAYRLGLSAPRARETFAATPEQHEAIAQLYASTNRRPTRAQCRELGERIGYVPSRIPTYARLAGLREAASRRWAEKELAILKRTAGQSVNDVQAALAAEGFKRSRNAVRNARVARQLTAHPDGETSWCLSQLAALIGCHHETLQKARQSGALRVRPGPAYSGARPYSYRVVIEDVVDWMENRASRTTRNRVADRVYALRESLEFAE